MQDQQQEVELVEGAGATPKPYEQPGPLMDGLDSDSDEDNKAQPDLQPEAPHKILIRQVDSKIAIAKASAAAAGGAKNQVVTLSKLMSLANSSEVCSLRIGWIFAFFNGCVIPTFLFMMGDVFDSFAGDEVPAEEKLYKVLRLVAIMFGLACFVMLGSYLQHYSLTKGALLVTRRIKTAYMKAILVQDSTWYDTVNYTELAARVQQETKTIETGIGHKYGQLLHSLGMGFSGLCLGFVKGWSLALPMLVLCPILIFGILTLIKGMTVKYMKQSAAFAKCAAFSDQAVEAIRIVVAFGMEQIEVDNYMRYINDFNDVAVSSSIKAALSFGVLFLAIYFGYTYAFFIGAIWVDEGFWNDMYDRPYQPGDIISVFFGILFGMFALGGLGPNMVAFAQAKAAGYKAFSVIERITPIDIDSEDAREHKMNGKICFNHIYFSYPTRKEQRVLIDFTHTFEIGKTTAIVGPSGSGKSTVVQLIERFYDPDEPEKDDGGKSGIFVDDIPLKDIKLRNLRNQIGYVGQEPVLFNMSIEENIRLGKPDATDAEIEQALRSTNSYEFVKEFGEGDYQKGVKTNVGQGGGQLSGGQKQRIALSRAFIKKPKLLIFDEATSALDKKNEMEVQKAIEEMKKELKSVTTIVIAHRLSTVRQADHILVLKKGKIAEQGSHDELLQQVNGIYYKLVNNQQEADKDQEKQNASALNTVHEEDAQIDHALKAPQTLQTDADNLPSSRPLLPVNAKENLEHELSAKGIKVLDESAVKLESKEKEMTEMCNSQLEKKEDAQKNAKLSGNTTWGTLHDTKKGADYAHSQIKYYAKPLCAFFISFVGSFIVGVMGPLFGFFIIKNLITVQEAKFLDESGLDAIKFYLVMMLSGAILSFFGKTFQQSGFAFVQRNVSTNIRHILYESIMRKDLSWHDNRNNSQGVVGNMLNAEVGSLSAVAIEVTAANIEGFSGILCGLIFAFIYSWPIVVAICCVAPLMLLGNKVGTRVKQKMWGLLLEDGSKEKDAEILLADSIANFKTVASIANEQNLISTFDKILEERCIKEFKETKCEAIQYGFTMFMQNFSFALIYLAQAVLFYYFPDYKFISQERIFVAMFALMFGVFAFVNAFNHVQDKDKALENARKMFVIMKKPSEIDALHEDQAQAKKIQPGSFSGRIEFRNVWFRYPERRNQWVFKGLNLTIEPNEVVAVVGESGAGKSTFISLIMRFYDPESGSVLIDGVDVKEYNISDLRRQMGLVMQEPLLFNYPIKDNILYGNQEATNRQIYNSAQIANALEFIESKELTEAFDDKPASLHKAMTTFHKDAVIQEKGQKYHDEAVAELFKMYTAAGSQGEPAPILDLIDKRDMSQEVKPLELHGGFNVMCGVKGNKLSGGQKQRVAIARAVVRNPKILLLDEATSALDEISQRLVQEALENVMKNRTSIVVAHRLTTVEKCSRVAVLQDGQIVESGTYQQLTASDGNEKKVGHFANLVLGMKKQSQQEMKLQKRISSKKE